MLTEVIRFITHILFISALGIYLITNLQWYHYKINRVLTKHHKSWWHFFYFALPIAAYHFGENFFWIFFYFAYLPSLYVWHKKLDKKLVVTWRVKRFLILLLFMTIFQDIICSLKDSCIQFGVFMPIIITVIGSIFVEKLIFLSFYKQAEKKIRNMHNLKIITITGSYGKTSIKNFLAQTLSKKYRVYATPKSVNTLEGIVKDINGSLDVGTDIYIVEAGAREKGDIEKISNLVQHHIAVVGRVGEQHIEYFKNIDKIIETKLEIVYSKRLTNLFLHSSINEDRLKVTDAPFKLKMFGDQATNIKSDLDGTEFNLEIDKNIENLTNEELVNEVVSAEYSSNTKEIQEKLGRIKIALENTSLSPLERRNLGVALKSVLNKSEGILHKKVNPY